MPDGALVTCAGCGLLCDDVRIDHDGDAVSLHPRCDLGAAWFSDRMPRGASPPSAMIDGRPGDVDVALSRAAELLRAARRPLVYGFAGATVEDARAAVALADRLGAFVATSDVGSAALALRGASTATLGEIRDRSELVVVWREDSETTHPRLLERLGFGDGAGRTLVVVDDRDTATARRADLRLRFSRERDLEALSALHVLQRRLELRPCGLEAELGGLIERLGAVPHAAFVYGAGLTSGAGGERRALALYELVRELCLHRHVVTLQLHAAPGTRSAQDVLAWQTGYPEGIDLASGHPELITLTTPLDADVALCVEGSPDTPSDGARRIALSSLPDEGVEVWIRTAAAGVDAAGTAHRLDGIPLTLQAPWPGEAPTAAAVLERLRGELERS